MIGRSGLFLVCSALLSSFFAHSKEVECVAVIVSGSESRHFWSQVIDGAIQAGEELGVTIHARSTYDDTDSQGQKFLLERTMRKYRCQGLVIAPSDTGRNQDVARLKAAGIPTVYIDRDTGGERIAVVKTNNYTAGALAAREMARALNGRTNVAVFRLKQGVSSTDDREQGFVDEAQLHGLVIISDVYLGTRVGDARWHAGKTLSQLEDIDGVFTPNDTTTIGVIKALELNKKHADVVHIGFDHHAFIDESYKAGKLHGYISQQPFEMGYQGVHTVYKALQGEESIVDIDTPITYYGPDSSDTH